MSNVQSYNALIDRFKAFASGHFILKSFSHGQIDTADLEKFTQYPFMHVVPSNVTYAQGTKTFSFQIVLADLPRDKDDKVEFQREVLSDLQRIAEDLVAEITNHRVLFGDLITVQNVTLEPFLEEFHNTLTGWTVSLDLLVPYYWDACSIPAEWNDMFESSTGGTGSILSFVDSITRDENGNVSLVNDEANPAPHYYYGTNDEGVRGWYLLTDEVGLTCQTIGTCQTIIDIESAIDALQTEILLKANTADISAVGFSNNYNDLDNKPTIPTSLPPTGAAGGDLTNTYPDPTVHRIHGVDMQSGTPTTNDVWVYGGSPAKWQHQHLNASQVDNDSSVTGATVKLALEHLDANKQATLVSGTNIKTIEGQSLLGTGNIDLTKSDVGLSNVDNTSDLNKPISTATQTALNAKQDSLVSGTNIKTVNSNSLLGAGNVSVGTVTSVGLTAGTGISVTGSPITSSGTITVTNSAPDQVVALTAGTGIGISGTYPNFTITNSSPSSGGTVTSVAALTLGTTGTDLSSTVANGTTTPVITLNVPTASATNRGVLSSTDWSTFNNKQNALGFTPVPNTRTLTINGTAFDLSADRSWTVSGTNIYNSDGSLTAARTLTLNTFALTIAGTSSSRFFANGNVGIGTTTDAGFKLDVNGTARVQGNVDIKSVSAPTIVTLGGFNELPAIRFINTNNVISVDSNNTMNFAVGNGVKANHLLIYGNSNLPNTSTTGVANGIAANIGFSPTSGTASFNLLNLSNTINQTGGANGITRGLYINPTLTAAADFRAIEVANGGAYINTTSVAASAILQADSTTKGFLPPRMTTTQKNAITSPAAGLVVYDTTLNKLCVRGASAWETITSL